MASRIDECKKIIEIVKDYAPDGVTLAEIERSFELNDMSWHVDQLVAQKKITQSVHLRRRVVLYRPAVTRQTGQKIRLRGGSQIDIASERPLKERIEELLADGIGRDAVEISLKLQKQQGSICSSLSQLFVAGKLTRERGPEKAAGRRPFVYSINVGAVRTSP